MMASAALREASLELFSLSSASSIRLLISGKGSCLPMMPVDATATSSWGMLRFLATWAAICSAFSIPFRPVKQFALPLLATIAESLPFLTAFLVTVMGAA